MTQTGKIMRRGSGANSHVALGCTGKFWNASVEPGRVLNSELVQPRHELTISA